MPVREFTGELDEPKVREFTGQLDSDGTILPPGGVPTGQSVGPVGPAYQNQLAADLAREGGVSSGPGLDISREAQSQVAQEASAVESEIPLFQRIQGRYAPGELAPLLGMGAAAMVPGAGWGALGLGSALAGGVTAAGEIARQDISGEPISVKKAAKEGAAAGAGNLAGGALLKGLGALAKRVFASPLPKAGRAAAQFAREQGAPFPLSSAAPGTAASMTQRGTQIALPAQLRTHADASKVAQFLNTRVGTLTQKASPLDDAAARGQAYLREAFEPGEKIYTDTFQKLRTVVGDETAVPLTHTRSVMRFVAKTLKERGETKAVFARLSKILKGGATRQTVQQLDELYSGLLKDTARNANARQEANAVLSALAKDIDDVSGQFGLSFTDDIAKAKAVRDQFRELRKIPQLERLSKSFGERGGTLGSRQWMSELFANPNGKALAELRSRNPELYHELADSWLANHLNRFSRPTEGAIGRVLDGKAMRAWFDANEKSLRLIFGKPQVQALDNFSRYAHFMTGAARSADRVIDPSQMMFRGATEAGLAYVTPYIIIPGEASAYVLAKGLSDPSSTLFRLFTEGFSPTARTAMTRAGQLAGQTAGRAQAD